MIEGPSASPRRLIFLGTGTSTGVPVLGCDCSVCTSSDPRNQRTRPSVLLAFPAGNLLIDTTPEMRIQLLRERMRRVHAIAFTHHHADHLFGLDDARLFPQVDRRAGAGLLRAGDRGLHPAGLPVRVPARTPSTGRPGFVPKIQFVRVQPGVPFEVLGERVLPIRLEHGTFAVLGFRDRRPGLLHRRQSHSRRELAPAGGAGHAGPGCAADRAASHPFLAGEALAVVDRLKPRRTLLTHLSHGFDHGPTEAKLPAGRGACLRWAARGILTRGG